MKRGARAEDLTTGQAVGGPASEGVHDGPWAALTQVIQGLSTINTWLDCDRASKAEDADLSALLQGLGHIDAPCTGMPN